MDDSRYKEAGPISPKGSEVTGKSDYGLCKRSGKNQLANLCNSVNQSSSSEPAATSAPSIGSPSYDQCLEEERGHPLWWVRTARSS